MLSRWEAPYATMDFTTEAKIVEEFHKFLMSGQLYRGSKPVMWSPVERTALADAEIEYHPHTSADDLGQVPDNPKPACRPGWPA